MAFREQENLKTDRADPCGTPREAEGMTGCCAFMMSEAGSGCPCGPLIRRHRVAILTILAFVAAAILVSQVGGILGIIAFVRTL